MEIEYDPEKDRLNQVKHGLSLARAADMDLNQAVITRTSVSTMESNDIGPWHPLMLDYIF